jgi:hypothetical protein
MSNIPARFAVVLCLVVAAAGCGHGRRAGISGTVTLDGHDLPMGSILFQPIEGTAGPNAGATIVDGYYEVPIDNGPFGGVYRVEIRANRKTGKLVKARDIPGLGAPKSSETMVEEVVEAVPARYNKRSSLRREVQAGHNVLDFDLSSAPQ